MSETSTETPVEETYVSHVNFIMTIVSILSSLVFSIWTCSFIKRKSKWGIVTAIIAGVSLLAIFLFALNPFENESSLGDPCGPEIKKCQFNAFESRKCYIREDGTDGICGKLISCESDDVCGEGFNCHTDGYCGYSPGAPPTAPPTDESTDTDAPVTDTDAPVTDAPVTDAPVTDAPPPMADSAVTGPGIVLTSDVNPFIISADGKYTAIIHNDGRFSVYNITDNPYFNPEFMDETTLIWQSSNSRPTDEGPFTLTLQREGNMIINDRDNGHVWGSGTHYSTNPGYCPGYAQATYELQITNGGKLALFRNHSEYTAPFKVWENGISQQGNQAVDCNIGQSGAGRVQMNQQFGAGFANWPNDQGCSSCQPLDYHRNQQDQQNQHQMGGYSTNDTGDQQQGKGNYYDFDGYLSYEGFRNQLGGSIPETYDRRSFQ